MLKMDDCSYIKGKYSISFSKQSVCGVPQYILHVFRKDDKEEDNAVALIAWFYLAKQFTVQACDTGLTKETLEYLLGLMNIGTFRYNRKRYYIHKRNTNLIKEKYCD